MSQIALGFPSRAKRNLGYKQIQRFLKTDFWKDDGIELVMAEKHEFEGQSHVDRQPHKIEIWQKLNQYFDLCGNFASALQFHFFNSAVPSLIHGN